jgi:hypothetical protein
MFESILCKVTEYDASVLEPRIGLAVEIAREGREGKRVVLCSRSEMRLPCSPGPAH